MLAQHKETGRIADIPDGQPLPNGYVQISEAERVPGALVPRCPECGKPSYEEHSIGCRMRKFLPWK